MKKIKDLKLAFLNISHWHVPLYLEALKTEPLQIAAVSDGDGNMARTLAEKLGCRWYEQEEALLEAEKPDFVFAFAEHVQMPAVAEMLIKRKIPFSMEKPLGTCAEDAEHIRQLAAEKGVFCAIPFIWRYSQLVEILRQEVKPEDFVHFSYIFTAGPPDRYEKSSPWMLERRRSGGGCMTNLGVHFLDMALYLSGSAGGRVLGSAYHYSCGYDVEDSAAALLQLDSGATVMLQTAYSYPMDEIHKRDNRWNFTLRDGYCTVGDGCMELRRYGREPQRYELSTDSDLYYAVYTLETLRQYLAGEEPRAGLDEMLRTRRLLDQIVTRAEGKE